MSATLGALVIDDLDEFSVLLTRATARSARPGSSPPTRCGAACPRPRRGHRVQLTTIAGFAVLACWDVAVLSVFGRVTVVDSPSRCYGVLAVLPRY